LPRRSLLSVITLVLLALAVLAGGLGVRSGPLAPLHDLFLEIDHRAYDAWLGCLPTHPALEPV